MALVNAAEFASQIPEAQENEVPFDAPEPQGGDFLARDVNAELKKFTPTDAAIAEMAKQFMPLTINGVDDSKGYKKVHEARMVVKNHRVAVEKRRKDLKADALEYGRRVDSEAKRITALLDPIELHLEREEKAYTDEKERIRREEEELERQRVEAELRAQQEAEASRIKAELEAEAARLKAEREAEEARLKEERERLAEERRKLDEERQRAEAERQKIEAERVEAARQEELRLQAERDRLAEIERQQREEQARLEAEKKRLADEEAERVRQAERERERLAAEERERIRQEEERKEALRLAAEQQQFEARLQAQRLQNLAEIQPDLKAVSALGAMLRGFSIPEVQSQAARDLLMIVGANIQIIADDIETFVRNHTLPEGTDQGDQEVAGVFGGDAPDPESVLDDAESGDQTEEPETVISRRVA